MVSGQGIKVEALTIIELNNSFRRARRRNETTSKDSNDGAWGDAEDGIKEAQCIFVNDLECAE